MAEIRDYVNNPDPQTADRWPENMSMSSVNDTARVDEGIISRWEKDIDGSLVSTGTGSAYILTTNRDLVTGYTSPLYDGLEVGFRPHVTNDDSPTINVGSTGALSIAFQSGDNLSAGFFEANTPYKMVYSSEKSAWIVSGSSEASNVIYNSNFANTEARSIESILREEVRVTDFPGVDTTGATDSAAAVQSAIDTIVAAAQPTILKFPDTSATIRLDTGLSNIDMNYLSLDFGATTLDFSNMSSGTALGLTNSSTSDQGISTHFLKDGRFTGPGESSGVKFIETTFSVGTVGVNRIALERIFAEAFQDMITGSEGFFLWMVSKCIFRECTRHFHFPVSSGTGGENFSAVQCTFGRSIGYAVDHEISGDAYFTDCSFDNNSAICRVTNGRVTFRDCHLEELSGNPWVESVGPTFFIPNSADQTTLIRITGGQFNIKDAAGVEYIFRNDTEGGVSSGDVPAAIRVEDCRINDSSPSSSRLGGGTGTVVLRKTWAQNNSAGKRLTGRVDNTLTNGRFDNGLIQDLIGVKIETGNIPTSRLVSPNLTISADTSARREWSFDANADVDTAADTISILDHEIETGTPTTYRVNGGTLIGGLTDNTIYYLRRVPSSSSLFQLATTVRNAWDGVVVDLTSKPAGSETQLVTNGDYGLLCTVTGTPAKVIIAQTIDGGEDAGQLEMQIRRLGGSGLRWDTKYGILIINNSGIEVIRETTIAGQNITGSAWNYRQDNRRITAPSWATHHWVEFNLDGASGSDFYADNVVMNRR